MQWIRRNPKREKLVNTLNDALVNATKKESILLICEFNSGIRNQDQLGPFGEVKI